MKNYQSEFASVGIALMAISLVAGSEPILDGGWRISAGAVYDSGVKTDIRLSPRQVYVTPYAVTQGAISRQQAEVAARGTQEGTKTTWVNGENVSWGDSADASAGHAAGHDDGQTTNYRFSEGVWNGNATFELGHADYEEVSSHQESFGSMASRDCDEKAMPGVSVQLSRNLYHDDDNSWGVEGAFAVQYSRRNNVVKNHSNWAIGNSSKKIGSYSAYYRATGDLADLLRTSGEDSYVDSYVWNTDPDTGERYVGAGGADGTAAPVDLDDVENTWGGEQVESDAAFGSLSTRGDYENLELMLLAQPYYDICEWMSVNATLGAVVARQSMDMSFSLFRNGQVEYASKKDFDQWDVYGVAGLGLMLYHEGFTLYGDVMARFFDRDMDISDRYYRGTVSRGDYLFRLGLGYEF